ncbi:hypothetical protein EUX98_g4392 [Antrodiella citrinella]|uniref:F-box domain-containing protein n=1 Tax=Antrodiella citrinella TaxID=2447956 RepID=A0A4S4MWW8_9APHY|nr:hypothetical protein EUX98_g4392 [Antrodiella citrinella]
MFFTRVFDKRKLKRSLERTFKKLLPMELMDMIMHHNHDDQAALVASSVVSSQWQGPAQRRLFRSFRITFSMDYTQSDPEVGLYVEFFSTVPTLSTFVTSLCIRSVIHRTQSLAADMNSQMALLVSMLPTLQHLTFENISFTPRRSQQTLLLKSIRNLSLRSIRMKTHDPEELFDLFSIKETLELDFTFVQAPTTGPQIARSMPVRHLKINNPLDCFPRFGRETIFPQLRALTCDIIDISGKGWLFDRANWMAAISDFPTTKGHHDNMDRFLRRHGPALEFLRINVRHLVLFGDIDFEDSDWTAFQLDTVCPNLQTLHLGFQLDLWAEACLEPLMPGEFKCTIDFLIRVISSAPRTLTSIVFGISVTLPGCGISGEEVTNFDASETSRQWKRLANVLDPNRFEDLAAVKFVEQETDAPMVDFRKPLDPVMQRLLAANFADVEKKGMLYFE